MEIKNCNNSRRDNEASCRKIQYIYIDFVLLMKLHTFHNLYLKTLGRAVDYHVMLEHSTFHK